MANLHKLQGFHIKIQAPGEIIFRRPRLLKVLKTVSRALNGFFGHVILDSLIIKLNYSFSTYHSLHNSILNAATFLKFEQFPYKNNNSKPIFPNISTHTYRNHTSHGRNLQTSRNNANIRTYRYALLLHAYTAE